MRRIIDLTSPNRPRLDDARQDMRYNRSIAVYCCAWRRGRPDPSRIMVGITKDLTDSGMGIITTCDLETEQIAVAVELQNSDAQEPWYFLGKVRQETALPGGCTLYGVELVQLLNADKRAADILERIVGSIQSVSSNAGNE